MKKTGLLILAAVMVLGLSACSGSNETNQSQTEAVTKAEPSVVTVKTLNGDKKEVDLEVPFDPKRVAVMDMAALDILEQLGLEERVVGASDTSLDYLEKYMEKETGINIKMVRNGYSNMRVSQKDVDEILTKYPDIDGIMTTSAVTALGLSEAVEGRGISNVSVDAQEDALKAVQDGQIVALGAQSGYQIGYETIHYIVKDLQGEGTGEDEILDSQVLTTENIDAYIKEDKYSSS